MNRLFYSLLFTLLFAGTVFATGTNQVFQVATIGSLARGVFDGDYTYGELFAEGNQGLGTLEGIDGEMVAVDSKYYQISAEGKLREVQANEIVPFAEVTNFKEEKSKKLKSIVGYDDVMEVIDGELTNKNLPYAIRIDGKFRGLHLRSLRKQEKPYTSLAHAATKQAIFDLKEVEGTIVGFWFPNYWAGIAVPGYHLHFVSKERDIGGHVLGLMIDNATLKIAEMQTVAVHLPKTESFSGANLDPESLHQDIKAAEGGMK